MSRLLLVRHGQASFLTDDYDRLSPLGEQQSRLLADYLLRHGVEIDAAFAGPRMRQIDTGNLVGEAIQGAGRNWPGLRILEGLDECHSELLLDRVLPGLCARHDDIRRLAAVFESAEDHAARRKAFQHMFDRVMRLYIHGEFSAEGLESWQEFTDRVNTSISRMIDEAPGGSTVAAFTSGGPIAVAAQRALGTDPDTTLELMWQSRNASVTEFLFSKDRFTMVMYNAVPHLTDATLWTHR